MGKQTWGAKMFKMSYMLPLRGGERPGTTDVWNLLQGGVEIATLFQAAVREGWKQ
jgi:hypothetical protein